MANIGTALSQSPQSGSGDTDATIEADNVLTLAEKRKLAEQYLMSTLCSSRDFDFMKMCDYQGHMPFCCEINEPSQSTQSGHAIDTVECDAIDTVEPQNDIKADAGFSPVFVLELPKWGTPEYWRMFQTDDR